MDKRIVFLALFLLLSVVALNVKFSYILGSNNKSFTYFHMLAPTSGAFLGPVYGVVSALGAEILDVIVNSKQLDFMGIFLMFPILFAVYYFGTYAQQSKWRWLCVVVPLAAIALFVIHPVGNQVWYYSLFWMIPLIALVLPKNVFLRSLGSTFTAHAVGSSAWIWLFPTTPEFWLMLIPIVIVERTIFAIGTTISFLFINNLLCIIEQRFSQLQGMFYTEKEYYYLKV